jgi:2',3'-cyclic-nucleotide 2'-phosphodiesterase (5'-nucleotidase family)
MITQRMLSRRISAYVFDDPISVAAKLVSDLRPTHDLVIALTHIGLKEDRRLASTVPGIDLIVGGHTHAVLDSPEMVGRTAIVQAGHWAHQVGRVDIDMDGNEPAISGSIMEL